MIDGGRNVSYTEDYTTALQRIQTAVSDAASGVSTSRRQRLEAQVTALTDELAKIANRPDEPSETVVKFSKHFARNGQRFQYAARQARDGYWYVTGTWSNVTPRRHTWDQLLDFIDDKHGSLQTLRVATGWRSAFENEIS